MTAEQQTNGEAPQGGTTQMPAPTHGRGWLSDAVKQVCDKILTGKIELTGKQKPTPHIVAKLVQVQNKLQEPPSTGAVAAVFERWAEYGFATFTQSPLAFKGYTAKGIKLGLDGLKAERVEARRKEREANKPAKPAKAPAKKAAASKPAAKASGSKAKKPPAKKADAAKS